MLERDGKTISLGRKTRTIPPALRRALRMRDRTCTFPGCSRRYHLHGHIHLYDRRATTVTRVGATEVINVYPFRELTLPVPAPA